MDRAPWYIVGPLLGLVVAGLLATINERLAVFGGYSEVVERLAGRSRTLGWKAFFLGGIVVGGTLFAALGGTWRGGEGYGLAQPRR